MSATIAAVANLKGGVGKSTTTLMLADGLAYYYGADVLVVGRAGSFAGAGD